MYPAVFPGNELTSLLNSEMICKWIVVMAANELGSDDFWYRWKALMMQNSINIFPVLLVELLRPNILSLDIFLKLVQPQLYAPNASFVRTFVGQLGLRRIPEVTKLGEDVRCADKDLL